MKLYTEISALIRIPFYRGWRFWYLGKQIKCFLGMHYYTRSIMMTYKCSICGKVRITK